LLLEKSAFTYDKCIPPLNEPAVLLLKVDPLSAKVIKLPIGVEAFAFGVKANIAPAVEAILLLKVEPEIFNLQLLE